MLNLTLLRGKGLREANLEYNFSYKSLMIYTTNRKYCATENVRVLFDHGMRNMKR